MEEYYVDFSGVTDKKSLHKCLKESLPLPEWYGDNLDALFDALTDLDEICIYFRNWEETEESMSSYFDSFRKVVADAQMEAEGLFCFFEKSGEEEVTDGPEDDVFPEESDGKESDGEESDGKESDGEESDEEESDEEEYDEEESDEEEYDEEESDVKEFFIDRED